MGLDPWTPMPEMESFYKAGACPDIAEWKQDWEEASRKGASVLPPATATTITAAPS